MPGLASKKRSGEAADTPACPQCLEGYGEKLPGRWVQANEGGEDLEEPEGIFQEQTVPHQHDCLLC